MRAALYLPDLLRFIRALGYEPTIVRLPTEQADR